MENTEIGIPKKSKEICSLSMVKRVAGMLDLDTNTFSEGDVLPRGWHFFLLAGETRKSDLRIDGFPGLGVPIPDLGLPRLLLGARTVVFQSDILIGSAIERTSFVKEIKEKTTDSGKMAIVTIQHELHSLSNEKPAIIETQTYILKGIRNEYLGIKNEELGIRNFSPNQPKISNSKTLIPDETILFQYSALGFNSHKIHIDRNYAQNVEGLPDLVVNGGLTTLLMTEFVRTELKLDLGEIKVKHIAPLYCNCPLTIVYEQDEIKIYNDKYEIAVEMLYVTALQKSI